LLLLEMGDGRDALGVDLHLVGLGLKRRRILKRRVLPAAAAAAATPAAAALPALAALLPALVLIGLLRGLAVNMNAPVLLIKHARPERMHEQHLAGLDLGRRIDFGMQALDDPAAAQVALMIGDSDLVALILPLLLAALTAAAIAAAAVAAARAALALLVLDSFAGARAEAAQDAPTVAHVAIFDRQPAGLLAIGLEGHFG